MSETRPQYIPAEIGEICFHDPNSADEISVASYGDLIAVRILDREAHLTAMDAAEMALAALKRAVAAMEPMELPERLESQFKALLGHSEIDPLGGLKPGLWEISRDGRSGVRCTWRGSSLTTTDGANHTWETEK